MYTHTNGAMPRSIFDDIDALKLPLDNADGGVSEVLTTVAVGRPGKNEFVRTHPTQSIAAAILEDKETRTFYFVMPGMIPHVDTAKRVVLTVAITTQGRCFLWPVPPPDASGRPNPWTASARKAAELSRERWVRLASDTAIGAYRVHVAEGCLPEPEWRPETLSELLALAFEGHVIDSPSHPVVQRLRGLTP